MDNSSGGKLPSHGQVAPINPTPNCHRCAPKGELLLGPAFTQMKPATVHYIQVSCSAYCRAAPHYCFLLNKSFVTDEAERSEISWRLLAKTRNCTC